MERDHLGNTTIVNESLGQASASWSHVELFFRHRLYRVNRQDLPFLIGRDDACKLQVFSDFASRHHCSLEIHEGQIGIFDRSTNGTFVELGRADSVLVKHEFCPLTGQGSICLGDRIKMNDPNLIMFKVVMARTQ